jgi:hypothetical protein
MVDTVDDPLVVQDPISTLSTVRIPVLRYYEGIYLCSMFYIGSESPSDNAQILQ